MISRAACRFIRISPRKARLVADKIRGKPIDEALAILSGLERRPRHYVQQVINSAVSNASVINPDIKPGDLYISKILIDCGPMFKRYRAGSMGRAMMIKHRTSHISVELDMKKEVAQHAEVKSQKTKGKIAKNIETKTEKKTTKGEAKTKTKKLVAAKRGR